MTRFEVKLTPGAARSEIRGWEDLADGQRILRVSVTAAPEKGKANAALIALLSKAWKLPKGAFTIVRGETDRTKVLDVDGVIPEGD